MLLLSDMHEMIQLSIPHCLIDLKLDENMVHELPNKFENNVEFLFLNLHAALYLLLSKRIFAKLMF